VLVAIPGLQGLRQGRLEQDLFLVAKHPAQSPPGGATRAKDQI